MPRVIDDKLLVMAPPKWENDQVHIPYELRGMAAIHHCAARTCIGCRQEGMLRTLRPSDVSVKEIVRASKLNFNCCWYQ